MYRFKLATAGEVARVFGAHLVGLQVQTQPMQDYPGGRATVTKLGNDAGAPEIVFYVQHPTWRGDEDGTGEIGVFDYEQVKVINDDAAQAAAERVAAG